MVAFIRFSKESVTHRGLSIDQIHVFRILMGVY